jgi:hypothetical protein
VEQKPEEFAENRKIVRTACSPTFSKNNGPFSMFMTKRINLVFYIFHKNYYAKALNSLCKLS